METKYKIVNFQSKDKTYFAVGKNMRNTKSRLIRAEVFGKNFTNSHRIEKTRLRNYSYYS